MDNEKPDLTHLFSQYQTLCRYCDETFARTFDTFQATMRCAKGCAACCVLETVAPLEAAVITSFLHLPGSVMSDEHRSPSHVATDGRCVFLHNDTCVIYPVRPIICRTHGLPLFYPEQQAIEVCPLNFTDVDLSAIDPAFLFDAEAIAANLMRLNLAYCMLTGQADQAGERIPLKNLLSKNL